MLPNKGDESKMGSNSNIHKIKSSIRDGKPRNLKTFEFTKIINPEFLYIGDNVQIDDFVLINAKPDAIIRIGSWVHINKFVSLSGGPVTIGDYCGISAGTQIIAGSDHYRDGALCGPLVPEEYRIIDRSGCIIKDFCWIGVNSCIFPGVTLREGCVVGAGSVVRQNLEPWGVYVMKSSKMTKISTRDKNKVYENVKKLKNSL